jgi:hypothetical protein
MDRSTAFEMVETATVKFVHPALGNPEVSYCKEYWKFSKTFCHSY